MKIKNNISREERLKTLIIFSGLAFGAIIMFAGGIPRYLKTKNFVDNSLSTAGVITEMTRGTRKTRSGTTKTAYYPAYRFKTKDGKTIQGKSSAARGPSEFKTGNQIIILYNPDNPNDSKMETFYDLWMDAFFFNSLGFILVIACLILLVKTVKIKT